jgi:hypothetical protein
MVIVVGVCSCAPNKPQIIRATEDYFRQLFKGMEIVEVYPGLYQSSAIRFWSKKRIKKLGVDVVIDLQGGFDPGMKFLKAYHYWPIKDEPMLPDLKGLFTIGRLGASYLKDRRKVLVHCTAGYNRSGLVNAMILHFYLSISGKEAMQMIRRARPGALYNQTFADFLDKLPPEGS